MEEETRAALVEVHNALCGIPVSGDHAIQMAGCLMSLRRLIQEPRKEVAEHGAE